MNRPLCSVTANEYVEPQWTERTPRDWLSKYFINLGTCKHSSILNDSTRRNESPPYHFVPLLGVAQPPEASESPGERPLLAVDGDGVVLAAAEVHDFRHVDGRDVSVFALLDVQDYPLRTRLKMETELGAGFEIFPVGIVT